MAATTTSKTAERAKDSKMLSGTQAHLATTTLTILGQQLTGPQIATRLQQRITLLDAATSARANYLAAVQAVDNDEPGFKQFVTALSNGLLSMYGNQPQILSDFSVAVRKTPAKKVEIKALAVDKMRATREARHTLGKRQKASIKGTVQPAVASASPAPSVPIAPSNVASAVSPATPSASSGTHGA
jgi:hypothetical protein